MKKILPRAPSKTNLRKLVGIIICDHFKMKEAEIVYNRLESDDCVDFYEIYLPLKIDSTWFTELRAISDVLKTIASTFGKDKERGGLMKRRGRICLYIPLEIKSKRFAKI